MDEDLQLTDNGDGTVSFTKDGVSLHGTPADVAFLLLRLGDEESARALFQQYWTEEWLRRFQVAQPYTQPLSVPSVWVTAPSAPTWVTQTTTAAGMPATIYGTASYFPAMNPNLWQQSLTNGSQAFTWHSATSSSSPSSPPTG